jgi:hypothetical protein
MEATLVGLAFALALFMAGVPFARLIAPDTRPVAFGAVVGLAVALVVTGDLAALLGYRSWTALIVGSIVLAIGWAGGMRARPKESPGGPLSPRLVLILLVTALALIAPLLILPVPMDTDAQGFGYLALMIRKGGTLGALAPWRPDIAYLYAPGALLIFATVSSVFSSVPMTSVMMGASHAAAFLFVCLAWDFGAELYGRDRGDGLAPRTWQRAMIISAAGSVGLWTALMDAHYTAIFGLLFLLAFLIALSRLLRTGRWSDAAVAAILLAAVAMTHTDSMVIAALGFGAFLFWLWVVKRPSWRRGLLITVGVPWGAFIIALPWVARILPLLDSAIRSPFGVSLSHWRPLLLYHGLLWPLLALVGAVLWMRQRTFWTLTMVTWLAAIVEFGLLGLLDKALPRVLDPFVRFHYPFSLAWHGPIIPYMALGAGSLVWLSRKVDRHLLARLTDIAVVALAVVIVLAVALSSFLPSWTQNRVPFEGCFATANDVLAMRWLRDHTPPGARVLNYPGDYANLRDWEAHWVPVVAERDCVYFRNAPFFSGVGLARARAEEEEMLAFWRNPAEPASAERLRAARLDFVIVPESIGDPKSRAAFWRWKPPAELSGVRSRPESAGYLEMVFQAGGAQVYRVRSAEEGEKAK